MRALKKKKVCYARKAPCACVNTDQVCRLRTDHYDLANYWILTDGYKVTLTEQTSGESPKGLISIPRKEFTKLVRWYLRPQRLSFKP